MKQKTSKGTLSPRKTRTTMTTSTDRHQGVHPSRRRTRQADKRRRRIRELFADPSPKVWATVCPARTTAPTAPNLGVLTRMGVQRFTGSPSNPVLARIRQEVRMQMVKVLVQAARVYLDQGPKALRLYLAQVQTLMDAEEVFFGA